MKKSISIIFILLFIFAIGCESVVSSDEGSYKKYGDPTMEIPAPEKPDTSPPYHE